MGTIRRLSDRIADRMEEALSRIAPDEDLEYDIAIVSQQDQKGGTISLAIVSLFARGVVVGEMANLSAIIPGPVSVPDERWEEIIREMLGQVYEFRTRQLAVANAEIDPKQFVDPVTPGGLALPTGVKL